MIAAQQWHNFVFEKFVFCGCETSQNIVGVCLIIDMLSQKKTY